jgi:uncharacterized protein
LKIAALNGRTEIVKSLIAAGACLDLRNRHCNYTALILASRFGHTEIVKLLIDSGA